MQQRITEEITVNGEFRAYATQTIRTLLAEQGIDPDRPGIAVAINAVVIPRSRWASITVQPGDQVEIVNATAGG
ncbi:MAG: sulfur carrier protein ThiS [Chloroflexales bacterium]|nr:sulfur carrier protein ThiS [Chloroflexales bacterium]